MEQRLSVIIEADVKAFNQQINQAEKNLARAEGVMKRSAGSVTQLENSLAKLTNQYKRGAISEKDFQRQAEKVSQNLQKQRAIVQNSQKEMSRLNTTIAALKTSQASAGTQKLGGAMSQLTGQVRGANGVAIEFNRIIQDAPFGLIGIGNNIQQLAGNFSNVSKNAGGAGKAIKASLSAMITPANLALLAISAITAAWTAYNMGAFDFAKKTNKAKEEAEKFAEGLDKFKESLDGVAKSQLEGAKSAQEELATLRALQSQASNTNLSYEQRIAAVNELQTKYPDYLGNLSKEEILSGDVGDAVDKLSTSLLASAKARAAVSRIAENSSKALEIELRANERVNKIIELQNQLQEKRVKLRSLTGVGSDVGANMAQLKAIEEIQRIEKQIESTRKEQVTDIQEIGKINEENVNLQDRYNTALEQGGSLVKGTRKEVEKLGSAMSAIDMSFLDVDIGDLNKRLREYDFSEAQPVKIPVELGELPVSDYDQKILEANDAIIEKTKQMEMVVSQTGIQISNAFANAFAQGLDSGENFFDSLKKGMKALLKQLAAQLAAAAFLKILAGITTGGTSTAFTAALGSNPFGGLFGGARAAGGPVSSGRSYLVGEQGPEMFVPKTAGTIIPNHANVSSPDVSSSAGGTSEIMVNVVGKIMNDTIVLSNQRGERKNGRMYNINYDK